MIEYPISFDAAVIGGGHAGCEAAWALAQSGFKTLFLTLDIDRIAQMSCNPSVGGIAKGHITKEIDALGGVMARVADESAIQYRTLNDSKGPAVRASRVQCDTRAYRRAMLMRLSQNANIYFVQAKVDDVLLDDDRHVSGILTDSGVIYRARCAVLCTGTFLHGLCHIGEYKFHAGRSGDGTSERLSDQLQALGIRIRRLKTGTPPRLSGHSLDYSKFEVQPGDREITRLSFYENAPLLPQVPCHIAYTTPKTHEIIRAARERSPLFNGEIRGIGPRYCPSIEDKVFRFSDKERHQIFIEPMGLDTDEIYPAGISSSLPFDVQMAFLHSIPGFEQAHVIRPAYAVEYDALESGQMTHAMNLRKFPSIFVAGQINGTSGYEEAAAQGLMAGINAARYLKGMAPFILRRDEAYIGVMIDDLVMKGADEPYRMFTSRAEFRLSLREDNADLRLSKYGHELGLLNDADFEKYSKKVADIASLCQFLDTTRVSEICSDDGENGQTQRQGLSDKIQIPEDELAKLRQLHGKLSQILKMPDISIETLSHMCGKIQEYHKNVRRCVETQIKFEGYIQRENSRIRDFVEMEKRKIPAGFDFSKVHGLTTEVLQKLQKYQPDNLGVAARISGVTPAAINAIWIALKSHLGVK